MLQAKNGAGNLRLENEVRGALVGKLVSEATETSAWNSITSRPGSESVEKNVYRQT
jgi:hypothetical protein